MSNGAKFKPGQSGNPAGRPVGTKDKRTRYRELLEPHADALVSKAVDLALEGDTTCLKMCIDRLIAPCRAKDAAIFLGGLEGSLTQQGQKIILEMGAGSVSPSEAATMLSALASQSRIIETDELMERIAKLEARNDA